MFVSVGKYEHEFKDKAKDMVMINLNVTLPKLDNKDL